MTLPRNTVSFGTLLLGSLFGCAMASAQMGILTAPVDEGPCSSAPAPPHFSIKAGTYSSPLELRLTARTRGAVIFYTTDGWTPTSDSNRYEGPIPIDKSATVRAIALVPNCSISKVAVADYRLPAPAELTPAAQTLPVRLGAEGALTLRADAQIPLVFASPVDSRTAQVGDAISLALAGDLRIGGTILAAKGTPAGGKVIQVDRSGAGDAPGEVQFEVNSLDVHGTKIPIHAVGALAGAYSAKPATLAIGAMSTGGLSLLFVHGKDAHIPAGAALTATMAAGTLLPNVNNLSAAASAPDIR